MIYLFMNNGGMGNQMFQYAVARRLQKIYNMDIVCDLSKFSYRGSDATPREFCLDQFRLTDRLIYKKDISRKIFCKIRQKMIESRIKKYSVEERYKEKTREGIFIPEGYYNFYQETETKKKNIYVNGLFQAHKYFDEILPELRREFVLKTDPSEEVRKIINKVENENSVCIHWRRGDYLADKYKDSLYVCGDAYYDRAIERIVERVDNPIFYIFTNSEEDAYYIQEHHQFKNPVKYINLMLREKDNDLEDFRIMCACKNFIISNSTYSWWAQYLCKHEQKIVCAPSVWNKQIEVKDLYEDSWEIIKC